LFKRLNEIQGESMKKYEKPIVKNLGQPIEEAEGCCEKGSIATIYSTECHKGGFPSGGYGCHFGHHNSGCGFGGLVYHPHIADIPTGDEY
jgi:hypothetical protein